MDKKKEEQAWYQFFETLTNEQLIHHAVKLVMDAERLRRELDDAKGVIR